MAGIDTNVNYAEAYGQVVDEKFGNARTSSDLWNSPSNGLYKWDGLHVKIPKIKVNGGSTYRSNNSLGTGEIADYSNDWEDKVVSFPRQWKTSVDPIDTQGSNTVVTISNITAYHNANDVVVEQDSFMYSKLFQEKQRVIKDRISAGEASADDKNGIYEGVLDESNILNVFDSMMTDMDEAGVDGDRILYVTPQIEKILKRADIVNRHADVNGSGDVKRAVASIDDVKIRKVPSKRMQTEFDFTNGTKLVDSAKQIQMFMIVNGIQLAPDKYQYAGLQAPTPLTNGNYLYYENRLSDVFLLDNKADGYSAAICDRPKKSGNSQPQPK